MRASAVSLSMGLGVGIPCLVAAIAGGLGWSAPMQVYLTIGGASFGIGLVVASVLDMTLYRAEAQSLLRQRNALTDQTMITTLERESRLRPQSAPIEAEPATIGEELTRLQRTRQFEIAHWRVYFRRIWGAGQAYGWDIRTLTDKKRLTRVTTQPGWNVATDALVAAGVLAKDGTTRALVSDSQWESERMWETVPPPQGEPPEILPPPYTKQQTRHETTAKQATVDG